MLEICQWSNIGLVLVHFKDLWTNAMHCSNSKCYPIALLIPHEMISYAAWFRPFGFFWCLINPGHTQSNAPGILSDVNDINVGNEMPCIPMGHWDSKCWLMLVDVSCLHTRIDELCTCDHNCLSFEHAYSKITIVYLSNMHIQMECNLNRRF